MSINLAAAVAAIPRAEDGHAITPEYHNKLRDVVQELARLLGEDGGTTQVLSLSPAFVNNTGSAPWRQVNGVAAADATATTTTAGYLPLSLPSGGRINKLRVLGKLKKVNATTPIGGLVVKLVRLPLSSGGLIGLLTLPLEDVATDASDNFDASAGVASPSGLGPAATAATVLDLQTIEASKYAYLLIAEADRPFQIAQINAIQIEIIR